MWSHDVFYRAAIEIEQAIIIFKSSVSERPMALVKQPTPNPGATNYSYQLKRSWNDNRETFSAPKRIQGTHHLQGTANDGHSLRTGDGTLG
jgi:hypothetical protein